MSKLRGLVCTVLVAASTPAFADPVICGDGSTSKDGPAACSRHGGVVDVRAKPRGVAADARPRATKRSQARMTATRRRTPAGVLCNDGTRSPGAETCSSRGGVAATITIERGTSARSRGVVGAKAAQPVPRLERSATARSSEPYPQDLDTILCNDGTVSKIGRAACTEHGGVSNGAEMFERHEGPIRERAPSTEYRPRSGEHIPGAGVPAPRAPVALCRDDEVAYDYPEGGTCSYRENVERLL
jgi:hypothetical protein